MDRASPHCAWQPFTFGGVASFAGASLNRIMCAQLITAALVAGAVIWLAAASWFPVAERAIDRLPEKASIHNRRLEWLEPVPRDFLAENQFLSIRVELENSFPVDQSADVRVILGSQGIQVQSLLGYLTIPYPEGWVVSLSRADARAWWGAWRTVLLIGVGLAVMLALFVSWLALACVYAIPVRLLAFYLDRNVGWDGSWRLACATLLPGAVVMASAIALYTARRLDLVGLLFAWLLHVVMAWVYVIYAPTRLARLGALPGRTANPFRGDR